MKRRDEDIRGWVGSLLFHVLLGLLFFLWEVKVTTGEPEYVELSFGTVSKLQTPLPPTAGVPGSEGGAVVPTRAGQRVVDLPQRKFLAAEEVLRIPESRKLEVEDRPAQTRGRLTENIRGQKDRGVGTGIGTKERFATPGIGDYAGMVADPRATGVAGNDAGSSVSMSMTWSDGGTRKKVSGELPQYPEGVNVEAQIKIETVVMPDGSVKSLKPAQKGNTKLEEAAMKAVRFWRFEPLRKSVPQREQVCTITFNFRLQ